MHYIVARKRKIREILYYYLAIIFEPPMTSRACTQKKRRRDIFRISKFERCRTRASTVDSRTTTATREITVVMLQ